MRELVRDVPVRGGGAVAGGELVDDDEVEVDEAEHPHEVAKPADRGVRDGKPEHATQPDDEQDEDAGTGDAGHDHEAWCLERGEPARTTDLDAEDEAERGVRRHQER